MGCRDDPIWAPRSPSSYPGRIRARGFLCQSLEHAPKGLAVSCRCRPCSTHLHKRSPPAAMRQPGRFYFELLSSLIAWMFWVPKREEPKRAAVNERKPGFVPAAQGNCCISYRENEGEGRPETVPGPTWSRMLGGWKCPHIGP